MGTNKIINHPLIQVIIAFSFALGGLIVGIFLGLFLYDYLRGAQISDIGVPIYSHGFEATLVGITAFILVQLASLFLTWTCIPDKRFLYINISVLLIPFLLLMAIFALLR